MDIDHSVLDRIDFGDFHCKHGIHQVFVPTKIDPELVYVNITEKGTDGCANAPRNSISWKIHEKGINFTVNVQTDICRVEWFAA